MMQSSVSVVCLSVGRSVCLSVCLSVWLFSVCLWGCLSVYPYLVVWSPNSVYVSVCLFVRLFVCVFACVPVGQLIHIYNMFVCLRAYLSSLTLYLSSHRVCVCLYVSFSDSLSLCLCLSICIILSRPLSLICFFYSHSFSLSLSLSLFLYPSYLSLFLSSSLPQILFPLRISISTYFILISLSHTYTQ